MKKGLPLISLFFIIQNAIAQSIISDQWVVTDAIGRKSIGYENAGAPRADKYVAINDTSQVYGRSYTQKSGMDNRPEAVNYGLNFQEQWEKAFELDPKLVFVTGWNEWIAGRYKTWQGTENAFPDQFCQEYSRDIEPMKGGHGDNYYYQLVNNIRKFKGIQPPAAPSEYQIQ